MNLFDANYLWASVIWGAIGSGYWIYGWRQKAMSPLFGGVAMTAVCYFVSSALLMSLLCVGLMAGVYWLMKKGY